MEWTNELIIEFLNLYEKHPVIWDPKNLHYKNRTDVADAWVRLKNELSVEIEVAILKKKKESLMSTYRTQKKKVTDSTRYGTKDVYKPTWFAYKTMDRFLRVIGKINSTLNTEDDAILNSDIDDIDDDNSDEVDLTAETISQNDLHEKTMLILGRDNPEKLIFRPPKTSEKRKRASTNYDIAIQRQRRRAFDVLETIRKQSRQSEQPDECSLYGELLATKLRLMDTRTRKILTNRIDNLVFSVEIQEIDKSTLHISRSTSSPHSSSYTSPQNSPSSLQYSYAESLPISCEPSFEHVISSIDVSDSDKE